MLNILLIIILSIILAPSAFSGHPSCLEQQTQLYQEVQHFELPEKTTSFSVLTYNLGMLNSWPISVPNYPNRNALLGHRLNQFIEENRPDFLAFQELWTKDVFSTVKAVAKYHRYQQFYNDFANDKIEKKGIQILISDQWTIVAKTFAPYSTMAWFENITGYLRGTLILVLENKNTGKQIKLTNTHLSPMKEQSSIRNIQFKEMFEHTENFYRPGLPVVHVGDLNFSDEVEYLDEKRDPVWELNRQSYEISCQFDAIDTYKMLNEDFGFSYDTRLNLVTHQGLLEIEPRQRLDYIFLRPHRDIYRIIDSKLVFTEELSLRRINTVKTQLSDHYGVFSTIQISY